ncbi:MAG: PcfK-like family protein [Clostridia bacterium]|nr:PcfK-like family protein [Clostridia bacterium]
MGRLQLKAETQNEQLVLAHLEKTASDALALKINEGQKTLSQCWNYIKGEARRLAVNGVACIEDMTVFGWAVHFFEEDSIKGEDVEKSQPVKAAKKQTDKPKEDKPEKRVSKMDEEQISIDLFL